MSVCEGEESNFKGKWLNVPKVDSEDGIQLSPERKLLLATLDRGICDARPATNAERKFVREARWWFVCGDEEPYSFLWICTELDINPNDVLTLLKISR